MSGYLKTLVDDPVLENFVNEWVDEAGNVQESQAIYHEMFNKLLTSWSCYASYTNNPYEQHYFLTKCILVCYSLLEESDRKLFTQELLKPLLNGVEKHLHSAFENVRLLGMVIGEVLMNGLFLDTENNDAKKILKFEYEHTDETLSLISLSHKQNQESIYKSDSILVIEPDLDSIEEQILTSEKNRDKIIFENKKLDINIKQSEEIDSDDEDKLETFDLSNDTVKKNIKKPLFLRDCLNSLIYSDEPAEIYAALKSVKDLCDTYHSELNEISVELLRVLLCKSNAFSFKEFDTDRMTAMISMTCHYPKECASYLSSQFYEAGYSLSQRGDVLNILVMSAQQLSDPNIEKIIDKRAINNSYINFNMITD
ncbi:telomere length regulation TEL2 -like protein, partial [Brachionus plicatilis]